MKDVTYTVIIKPAHDMFETTRIVLTIPEHLTFKTCSITYTEADCELVVDPITGVTEMYLTNIFNKRIVGGSEIKFIIATGDNPIGARYAGNWGARTEGVFDGKYYIVDGNQEGNSFFAKPGFIKSTLEYEADVTFTTDSVFTFEFETEHEIPIGGYMKVQLPEEMAFP